MKKFSDNESNSKVHWIKAFKVGEAITETKDIKSAIVLATYITAFAATNDVQLKRYIQAAVIKCDAIKVLGLVIEDIGISLAIAFINARRCKMPLCRSVI